LKKQIFSKHYSHLTEEISSIVENFDYSEGALVGNGNRNIIKVFKIGEVYVNIKSFKEPNLINKWVYRFLRKSKAERSYENAHILLKNNIGTPKPIAYIEETSFLFFKKSFYISEHIKADLTYRNLVLDTSIQDSEVILREMARFTHSLHQNGILFKDHSPGNTLIQRVNDSYKLYLVDLNRMAFRKLSFNERIKNFSRLTPKQEMIEIMANEYAICTGKNPDKVFALMWGYTNTFQEKYYRKKRWKKRLLFWRKN